MLKRLEIIQASKRTVDYKMILKMISRNLEALRKYKNTLDNQV